MDATPLRTRQRIIELYAEGKKTKEIAGLFGLCKAATRRVKQHLRERGTLQPLPRRAGAKGKFTPELRTRLAALVAAKPDATLAELQEDLGVKVAISTVDAWRRKLGLRYKKSRSRRPSSFGPT